MRLSFKQKVLCNPKLAKLAFNCWPPLWGTGIWVKHIAKDYKEISVLLKLKFYNRNYIGIHFGGNLFTMTDPFYTLMLFKNLGSHFFICDKSANIEFIKPGKGLLQATFVIQDKDLTTIKEQTRDGSPLIMPMTVYINDYQSGELVAKVTRELFVSLKRAYKKSV
jgi:acyl-coenzyme A thioesterase PaaI-like protein